MVGIKVVRILSAVVLLVQCATCDFTRDEQKVYDVLRSYIKFRKDNESANTRSERLVTVRDHIHVFPKFTLSNVLGGGVTSADVAMFDIKPSYCPTTTMLACGEADVSDEFCLQLLDRIYYHLNNAKPRVSTVAVDADVEFEPARASLKTRVRTPTESSRMFPLPSIQQQDERRAENVETLLTTDSETLGEVYGDFAVKLEAEFKKQSKELMRKKRELMGLREEWVKNKSEARRRQLSGSAAVLKMLNEVSSKPIRPWIVKQNWSIAELRSIASDCYPEQFIVCGRHVQSFAYGQDQRGPLNECFEMIMNYNAFRRLVTQLADEKEEKWITDNAMSSLVGLPSN